MGRKRATKRKQRRQEHGVSLTIDNLDQLKQTV